MVLSRCTSHLIILCLLIYTIGAFGNLPVGATNQLTDEKESGNITFDDASIHNVTTLNGKYEDNFGQEEILYSDKFEVINGTAKNDTVYFERFDNPVKKIQTGPTINDPHLGVEVVFKGIKEITNMAFLEDNDILYLEQREGTVKRIINGNVIPEPLLTVNVNSSHGLVGITVSAGENNPPSVFLFFTETIHKNDTSVSERKISLANRVYKYELLDNKLVNPKLILNLPAFPGPDHQGGEILIGPDSNLYVAVGDIDGFRNDSTRTMAQNYKDGTYPDGRAGILRVTQNGGFVENGILGNTFPLNLYYAYGVKNSFGIDFDPVTGKLWLTENGPRFGDEINLAEPGFNSGSDKIFGIWRVNDEGKKLKADVGGDEYITVTEDSPSDLVYFEGKGHYSPPEFTWDKSVAPTALLFLDSDKLGSQYENDMFVGSVDGGRIFHFDLNENRTGLDLKGVLEDKIATGNTEYGDILFAEGFSIITDLKKGPDGYLYVVSALKQSKTEKLGAVYRILPS